MGKISDSQLFSLCVLRQHSTHVQNSVKGNTVNPVINCILCSHVGLMLTAQTFYYCKANAYDLQGDIDIKSVALVALCSKGITADLRTKAILCRGCRGTNAQVPHNGMSQHAA